jgi:type II secretory pathway pseudopilin PulG
VKEGFLVEAVMNKLSNEQVPRTLKGHNESGFTLLQLVIVIAIIAVLSTVALLGVTSARASQRRINSARLFAGYLEKARVDSVRRHADGSTANPLASVTVLNANTYSVFMDFNNTGVPVARNVSLELGITFDEDDIGKEVAFDWRGRTGFDHGFVLSNADRATNTQGDRNYETPVAVSGFGDVTINDGVYTPTVNSNSSNYNAPTPLPTPTPIPNPTPIATPSSSPSPSPSATPDPNATPNPNPTPTPATPTPTPATPTPTPATPTPTPATPTPTPTPAGGNGGSTPCSLAINPASASIRKNGIGAASVTVRVLNALTVTTVTATPSNANEIAITPTSASVPLNGSAAFSVKSKRNNAGFTYQVTFSSANCGSASFRVTVTN